MTAALVLVDGEHYPPVVEAALRRLQEQDGLTPVAALFLGGTEKTSRPPDLGVPIHAGDPVEELPALITRYRPALVVDLSDEPVLDYRRRFRLAGLALAAGVAYRGGGFHFDPPPRPRLTSRATVAVIGTGKRTGKTAVSIELARYWRDAGRHVVIVTMGRGGPPEPIVLRAGEFEATAAGLRALAERGLHAASDYVEDALFAGVDTVGTRRCGAGPAGITVDDNFHLGVSVAEGLAPDLMIYEGSGAALPPARADATVLVVPADIDPEYLTGYFGPYRLAIADAVVVIETNAGAAVTMGVVRHAAPDVPVLAGRYEPEPSIDVAGRRVLLATTAPAAAGAGLRRALERRGAETVSIAHALSDRRRLADELADTASTSDLVLVEVKAAAVDVVVPWAEAAGLEVGFVHNRVDIRGGTGELAAVAERGWAERAEESAE